VNAKIQLRDVMVGVPLGIGSQLILVNAVTWPLSKLFPDAFSFDEVSKRASDLADNANGIWIAVLILVVVVGAPVVEEVVYRGIVQPGLVAAWGARAGMLFTAVLFAAIHFQPIEFPGLLAFALVLGWARQSTDRLGLPVITHTAFNATGLLLVFLV
jgi:membrane protease YdiL (CAAX protease family)